MQKKNNYNAYIFLGILIVIVLLLLLNYQSLNNRYFVLKGSERITINVGDMWEDPGVIYTDGNGDLSSEVSVNNKVDFSSLGTYYVDYSIRVGLFTKSLQREIIVVGSDEQSDIRFKLNGGNIIYFIKGEQYEDPGVEIYDIVDGNISPFVENLGSVNTNTLGEYEIVYRIKNSNGVIKELKRKVIVYNLNLSGRLKYDGYVKENEILLEINDKNYQYTMLPNNQKTNDKFISYPVMQNGLYIFQIYDDKNNIFKYEIDVNSIDNTPPTGSCSLYLSDIDGEISVNASDNNKIKGYIYHYGINNSSLTSDITWKVPGNIDNASVTIYDEADNSTKIICNTTDKSSYVPRSYTLKSLMLSDGFKYDYWLYTPKTSSREKLPLMVYFHGDGGMSENVNDVNLFSYPAFVKNGQDFPFYMIAPHASNNTFNFGDKPGRTMELINYIIKNYNIDTDRIIVVGGSSGGRGAFTLAATYQHFFSCLVLGSGITYTLNQYEDKLIYLPIWIFHGANDAMIDYKDVERHANRIKSMGGDVTFTLVQGAGHDITETFFKKPELIEWMINQRRK